MALFSSIDIDSLLDSWQLEGSFYEFVDVEMKVLDMETIPQLTFTDLGLLSLLKGCTQIVMFKMLSFYFNIF